MKAVRYLTFAAGGLVLLVLVAAGIAIGLVDGDFVKRHAQGVMQDKQRTLSIEGTPKVSLFPVLGLELGRLKLSEPKSGKEFLSLESAKIAVKVLPLLKGAVEIDALETAGLKLNLVRAKDGSMNTGDLDDHGNETQPARKDRKSPQVRIAEARIERAQIAYRDEATGRTYTIADINLKAGRLAEDAPAPVSFSFHAMGTNPAMDVKVNLGGELRIDLAKEAFEVAALVFEAKGVADGEAFAARISAPKVSVTADRASGAAITGTLALKGPRRRAEVNLNISAVQGTAAELSIGSATLELDAVSEGNGIKGRIETPIKAGLKEKTLHLPAISANLTFSGPAVPQKIVTLPIKASLKADFEKQSASADLATKFDDSNIEAKFTAARFSPLNGKFEVSLDKLNLDRYIAQKPSGASRADDRIDLAALRGPTLAGTLRAGALQANGVKVEKLEAHMRLEGGKLDLYKCTANLYGGSLVASAHVDSTTNHFQMKDTLSGVAIGPLLRDVAKKDMLEGRGNLSVDVSATGASVHAVRKALAGTAKVDLKDGAIKGINLAESLRNFKSTVGGKSAQTAGDSSKKTDLSELSASFRIKDGIAANDDLKALSPFLRLTGTGTFDIGNSSLDYLAKATLAATSKGQGGAADVAGFTVPVKLTGPFDNPSWSIDFTGLLGNLGIGAVGAVGGAAGKATDSLKSVTGGVKDKLKALFGR